MLKLQSIMSKAEEASWLRVNMTATWHAVLHSQLTGKQILMHRMEWAGLTGGDKEWRWMAVGILLFFFSFLRQVPSKVDPQSLGRYQTVPGVYPLPLKCNILGKSREPAQALSGLSPARNACFVHVKKDERRAKCVESKPSLRKRISGSN